MKLLNNTFIPTIIILLAAALIVTLVLPLAGTEWADSFRTESETSGEVSSDETTSEPDVFESEDTNSPALFMLLLPIVKVIIFMSIGGLITILIRRLIRQFRSPKQRTT